MGAQSAWQTEGIFGDFERPREVFRALGFFMATDSWRRLGNSEICLPATSFLEMGNLAPDSNTGHKGNFIYNIDRRWFPLWLIDVPTPG